uniref:Uncharacterized protein n=1 Tax=Quercus lobata TaxID=97700 RepID=A0A7N2L4D6_QUELO
MLALQPCILHHIPPQRVMEAMQLSSHPATCSRQLVMEYGTMVQLVAGRLYLVRCITTTSTPYACNQNQTIQIKIVGYIGRAPFAHSTYNATIVLSNTAFGTIANSSTGSSYINIEFERVHGEDVVPLARGPVSPSAPNPTTDDRRGHYKVHGQDVVPLARGPVSHSAPNPTTEDAVGHYP